MILSNFESKDPPNAPPFRVHVHTYSRVQYDIFTSVYVDLCSNVTERDRIFSPAQVNFRFAYSSGFFFFFLPFLFFSLSLRLII